MAKGVFATRISPSYDDVVEERYHFPRTYLNQVEQIVGDFVIYYEPSRTGMGGGRAGRQSYFAVAQVVAIREDPDRIDHFYADMEEFLEFDFPVPFRVGELPYEGALDRGGGQLNRGAFRRAVRLIQDQEFEAILVAGFQSAASPNPELAVPGEFHEPPVEFIRPMIEQILNRPFRDAKFRSQVRFAYSATCAMTGLRIINGGGNPEVDAAHIRPIGHGHNGPDSVRNGLALSKTVHWMFDRGLISVSDDYQILIAKNNVPDPAVRLFNPDGRLILPKDEVANPHPAFLKYHRDQIFKG